MLIKRRSLITGAAATTAFARLERSKAQTCGTFYPAAPTPAANAGYTTLLFQDDFTVAGTIAPSPSPTSGYNWYLASNATTSNASVNTTATAASISNGNTGGGLFPSGLGGILTINGPNDPGNGNVTIFSIPVSIQKTGNPGYGCWGPNVYIEVYAQYNPVCTATNQWYAPLWFDSQTYINTNQIEEIDVIENYCGNFGYTDSEGTFGGHQWVSGAGSPYASGGQTFSTYSGGVWTQINMDANWHAYGFTWTATSPTTGTLQSFFDNVGVYWYGYTTSQINVGVGGSTGFANLQTGYPLFAIIGGPPGYNMNIDYVRVWGA